MTSRIYWKFQWLTRWEEIWSKEFVLQWQTWLENSPSAHVFFHPVLAKAWVDTYLPLRDIRPCFLIAESYDHTVFFPIILWQRNWKNAFQRLLMPVGYSDYDYHDPIVLCAKGEEQRVLISFWAALAEVLFRTRSSIHFDRFILGGIRQAFIGDGEGWEERESCPWLNLKDFNKSEDFLPSLKTSLRGDLRRQERRINTLGILRHHIFESEREENALQELVPFLTAHAQRWPAAYKAPHLHENIVRQGLKAGIIHFSMLEIGGESAAWHLGFIFQGRFYYYLPAQNEKFDRLSPGKVLLLKCIEDAIKKQLSIYDFLRGEESYKAGWTDEAVPLWSLQLDKQSPVSRLCNWAGDRLKPMLKASTGMM